MVNLAICQQIIILERGLTSSLFYYLYLKTIILKLDMKKKGGKMMYLYQTNNFKKTRERGKYTLFKVFINEKT